MIRILSASSSGDRTWFDRTVRGLAYGVQIGAAAVLPVMPTHRHLVDDQPAAYVIHLPNDGPFRVTGDSSTAPNGITATATGVLASM